VHVPPRAHPGGRLGDAHRRALRDLHGRVAAAYEELFAGTLDDHVDVLAYHYYRSDDQSKALAYLERAADRATAQGAPADAAELLRRAQKVAGRVGDQAADRRLAERLRDADGS
jgi:hypothetical protein